MVGFVVHSSVYEKAFTGILVVRPNAVPKNFCQWSHQYFIHDDAEDSNTGIDIRGALVKPD